MLNAHHRRRLGVRFGRLIEEGEDLLDRMDAATDAATAGGEDLARLRQEIRDLAEAARDAAERLGIPLAGASPDLRHRVQAWSAAWWTRMLDCRPEKLGGLGPVDPEDAGRVEEAVEAVAARLARLQRLSRGE